MRDPSANTRRIVESALRERELELAPPLAEVGSTTRAAGDGPVGGRPRAAVAARGARLGTARGLPRARAELPAAVRVRARRRGGPVRLGARPARPPAGAPAITNGYDRRGRICRLGGARLARVTWAARCGRSTSTTVYRLHSRAVYASALAVLRDPGRAEDVTQEVFLRLWRDPGRFDPARGPLGPYLRLMARSRALDLWRSERSGERARERAGLLRERDEAPDHERPDVAAEHDADRTHADRGAAPAALRPGRGDLPALLRRPRRDRDRRARRRARGHGQGPHPDRAREAARRGRGRMTVAVAAQRALLDEALPEYDVNEVHSRELAVPPEVDLGRASARVEAARGQAARAADGASARCRRCSHAAPGSSFGRSDTLIDLFLRDGLRRARRAARARSSPPGRSAASGASTGNQPLPDRLDRGVRRRSTSRATRRRR